MVPTHSLDQWHRYGKRPRLVLVNCEPHQFQQQRRHRLPSIVSCKRWLLFVPELHCEHQRVRSINDSFYDRPSIKCEWRCKNRESQFNNSQIDNSEWRSLRRLCILFEHDSRFHKRKHRGHVRRTNPRRILQFDRSKRKLEFYSALFSVVQAQRERSEWLHSDLRLLGHVHNHADILQPYVRNRRG